MTDPVKMLSDGEVSEIEARANAATGGPWQRGGNYWDINTVTADAGKYFIADCHKNPMSAEFIAHAREDIPALCATARALRDENSTLKKHWADTSEDLASAWLKNDELKEQLAQLSDARDRLRDQLAQVTQERDDLLNRGHQTVLFDCGCMFKQEGLDAEPMLIVHCATKEQP